MKFVVLKISDKWKSKQIENSTCRTLIVRDMESPQTFKSWPCTAYETWDAWELLKKGDIFTDVGIFREKDHVLSAKQRPRVVGHANEKQMEEFEAELEKKPKPAKSKKDDSLNHASCAICLMLTKDLNKHLDETHQVTLF